MNASPLLPAAAILILAACGPSQTGPPEIVLDLSACSRCSMLVSELSFAAAYRPRPGAPADIFDDIGCMLAGLEEQSVPEAARLWVRDAQGHRWLEAGEAVFVRSETLSTPMASGLVAAPDRAAAEALAARLEGSIAGSLADLRAAAPATGVGR